MEAKAKAKKDQRTSEKDQRINGKHQRQECIPVRCVPPACWPYPSMHCPAGCFPGGVCPGSVCIQACNGADTPLWTGWNLWKHNLRKLCLRVVKIFACAFTFAWSEHSLCVTAICGINNLSLLTQLLARNKRNIQRERITTLLLTYFPSVKQHVQHLSHVLIVTTLLFLINIQARTFWMWEGWPPNQ